MLISIRSNAEGTFKSAFKLGIPVKACKIKLMGIHNKYVMSIPSTPDEKPIITVSALNIFDTFAFDAPSERSIPISFVLYCTEIRVITAIIIDETISEIATKAIST